jgi:DNA-binding HxlR family transcriptional regulator
MREIALTDMAELPSMPRPCSVAASLEVLGERWSLLAIRELGYGVHRFDKLVGYTGASRDILADRLRKLEAAGVVERRLYNEHPPRYEYRLTDRGRDLYPVAFGLMRWGDKHAAPAGPPRIVRHRGCGGAVDDHLHCEQCGAPLTVRDVETLPGPGARAKAEA